MDMRRMHELLYDGMPRDHARPETVVRVLISLLTLGSISSIHTTGAKERQRGFPRGHEDCVQRDQRERLQFSGHIRPNSDNGFTDQHLAHLLAYQRLAHSFTNGDSHHGDSHQCRPHCNPDDCNSHQRSSHRNNPNTDECSSHGRAHCDSHEPSNCCAHCDSHEPSDGCTHGHHIGPLGGARRSTAAGLPQAAG
jgi:hypothetical protein